MFAENKFGTMRKMTSALLLALILGLLLPVTQPQSLYAKASEYGYLWRLQFDFNGSYDGLLTLEVGPWKNGELVEVKETSSARVTCKPIGAVALVGGSAVFNGGHLDCSMHLAEIVMKNHKLPIAKVDNYGSILMNAKIKNSGSTVAPIFTHPDAEYAIDFTQTSSVTMRQELWNGAGLTQATFLPMPTFNIWRDFTYMYNCISNGGPCTSYFVLTQSRRAHLLRVFAPNSPPGL
jgi:hypothetical protein